MCKNTKTQRKRIFKHHLQRELRLYCNPCEIKLVRLFYCLLLSSSPFISASFCLPPSLISLLHPLNRSFLKQWHSANPLACGRQKTPMPKMTQQADWILTTVGLDGKNLEVLRQVSDRTSPFPWLLDYHRARPSTSSSRLGCALGAVAETGPVRKEHNVQGRKGYIVGFSLVEGALERIYCRLFIGRGSIGKDVL